MLLVSCCLRRCRKLFLGTSAEAGTVAAAMLVLVTVVPGPGAHAVAPEWVAKWKEDLHFARENAVKRHPNLFHALSHDEWDREFETLIGRLGELEHHEITTELARIMARVQDGHTRLTLPLRPGIDFMQGHSKTPEPHLAELQFHQYPVRFAIDPDGVYVQRIASQHRQALGGRIVRLGRLDVEAALEAVTPTVRYDNEMQIRHHLPTHLVLAELLHARGVTETPHELHVQLESVDGLPLRLDLQTVPHGDAVDWADARDGAGAPLPLYLQHPERKFWFLHLVEHDTVYLQFNEVYNEEDEALRDFAMRVGAFLTEHGVENLIIDLRNNRGGNMSLARPLLRTILCSDVNRTGHLFTLVGRTTFSAAMNFTLMLEKHTRVLFVGEPTGSTPNHYGDSRKIRLPNTGLTLRVSTLYHQYDPTDARPWVPPHIPVDLTAADYRSNRDPALDTILDIVDARAAHGGTGATAQTTSAMAAEAPADADGTWSGLTSPGLNMFELSLNVRGAATAPEVELRIPALGLETKTTSARVTDRRLRFETSWREEPVVFTGTVAGDWFIGEGDFRSVYFPFVLRRQPDGRSPAMR